MSGIKKTRK